MRMTKEETLKIQGDETTASETLTPAKVEEEHRYREEITNAQYLKKILDGMIG